MRNEHAYRVAAWWTSGRTGLAKSDSAPNAIHFTAPTEFGGLEGRWTPEELLLASIASCFSVTVRAVATRSHFDFVDLQVETRGTVRKADSGYHFSETVVHPCLTIACQENTEQGLKLLKLAENLCLVSRALHTRLDFEHQVVVVETAESASSSNHCVLEGFGI